MARAMRRLEFSVPEETFVELNEEADKYASSRASYLREILSQRDIEDARAEKFKTVLDGIGQTVSRQQASRNVVETKVTQLISVNLIVLGILTSTGTVFGGNGAYVVFQVAASFAFLLSLWYCSKAYFSKKEVPLGLPADTSELAREMDSPADLYDEMMESYSITINDATLVKTDMVKNLRKGVSLSFVGILFFLGTIVRMGFGPEYSFGNDVIIIFVIGCGFWFLREVARVRNNNKRAAMSEVHGRRTEGTEITSTRNRRVS